MPSYDTTENPALDTEDWEIALDPYGEDPGAALTLGFHLMTLKRYLDEEPPMIREALDGIDCALEVLFQHTEFHDVSYALFVRLAGGKLTLPEERMLHALGVKF